MPYCIGLVKRLHGLYGFSWVFSCSDTVAVILTVVALVHWSECKIKSVWCMVGNVWRRKELLPMPTNMKLVLMKCWKWEQLQISCVHTRTKPSLGFSKSSPVVNRSVVYNCVHTDLSSLPLYNCEHTSRMETIASWARVAKDLRSWIQHLVEKALKWRRWRT